MVIDEKLARLRAHRNNISRYRRLLRTKLSALKRQYIERRLSEEKTAVEALSASTFQIAINASRPAGPHTAEMLV
ncbi:U3 small nucleolar ribonucleoprotein component [Bradyrhizobium japonicum]